MEKTLLADTETVTLPPLGGPGFGPFGEWWKIWGEGKEGAIGALKSLAAIISNIIGIMTIAAGIWFMFQFIIAGFSWITAGGNAEAVNNARNRMRDASIGLIIVVSAVIIVGLFGKLLDLDILLTHPEKIINQLKPGGG